MQLAPADQHRADLGELAALAREPVRLRVEGDELGGGERLGEQGRRRHPDSGSYASLRTACRPLARARRMTAPVWATFRACRGSRGERGRAWPRRLRARSPVAAGAASDYANKPRPASPINVTAAISDKKISISPKTFGAGPIVMIISNQTDATQTLTLADAGARRQQAGHQAVDRPDRPARHRDDEGRRARGRPTSSARGGGVKPASVEVGGDRKSAQDELLEP